MRTRELNLQAFVTDRSKFLLTVRLGALNEIFYLLSSGKALKWVELQACVNS